MEGFHGVMLLILIGCFAGLTASMCDRNERLEELTKQIDAITAEVEAADKRLKKALEPVQ